MDSSVTVKVELSDWETVGIASGVSFLCKRSPRRSWWGQEVSLLFHEQCSGSG